MEHQDHQIDTIINHHVSNNNERKRRVTRQRSYASQKESESEQFCTKSLPHSYRRNHKQERRETNLIHQYKIIYRDQVSPKKCELFENKLSDDDEGIGSAESLVSNPSEDEKYV